MILEVCADMVDDAKRHMAGVHGGMSIFALMGVIPDNDFQDSKEDTCVECVRSAVWRMCQECEDPFCEPCYRLIHRTGNRAFHTPMVLHDYKVMVKKETKRREARVRKAVNGFMEFQKDPLSSTVREWPAGRAKAKEGRTRDQLQPLSVPSCDDSRRASTNDFCLSSSSNDSDDDDDARDVAPVALACFDRSFGRLDQSVPMLNVTCKSDPAFPLQAIATESSTGPDPLDPTQPLLAAPLEFSSSYASSYPRMEVSADCDDAGPRISFSATFSRVEETLAAPRSTRRRGSLSSAPRGTGDRLSQSTECPPRSSSMGSMTHIGGETSNIAAMSAQRRKVFTARNRSLPLRRLDTPPSLLPDTSNLPPLPPETASRMVHR